jgi:ribosomal protein S18 acetylase RimI-like enzyme
LFEAVRAAQFAPLPIEMRDTLVAMQYTARERHYQSVYPALSRDIIVVDGTPVGALMVSEQDVITLADISVHPEHQRRGIGTGVLRDLLDRAQACGKDVILHVDHCNPARSLYERLAFAATSQNELQVEMRWKAEAARAQS